MFLGTPGPADGGVAPDGEARALHRTAADWFEPFS
jgi:hypothetical protein